MRRIVIAAVCLIAVGAGLVWWMRWQQPRTPESLAVFCPQEFRALLDEVAGAFESETGRKVRIESGLPSVLTRLIETSKSGDVLIADDGQTLRAAEDKGLIASSTPITVVRAMVGVKTGNPLKVRSIADLLRTDVRLSLPDPKSSSLGQSIKAKLGVRWNELWTKGILLGAGANDVARHVSTDMADAAFVWSSTPVSVSGIDVVELAEIADVDGAASACVLRISKQPELARSFIEFLTATDRGGAVFAKRGYLPAGTKPWSPPPRAAP